MADVIPFDKNYTVEDALAVIDDLRARVESGEIKAFIGVGISPDHTTACWLSRTQKTTRLEILGALSHLNYCWQADDL